MTDGKMKVRYLGAKPGLVLKLKYLKEKNIDFSGPDKTAEMRLDDASRLIAENPRSFRLITPKSAEAQSYFPYPDTLEPALPPSTGTELAEMPAPTAKRIRKPKVSTAPETEE